MTFADVLTIAMSESEDFTDRMHYWVHKRKRYPNFEWMLSHIIAILGAKRTQELLAEVISKANEKREESDGQVSTGQSGQEEGHKEQEESSKDR